MIERRSASGESSTDALNSTVDSRCKKNLVTCCIQDIGVQTQYVKHGGIWRGKVKMGQLCHRVCLTSSVLELPVVCYLSVTWWRISRSSANPPCQNPLMTQSVFSPEMFLPRYSKYPTTEDIRLAMDGKILLFLSALLGFICFNIDE